MPMIDQATVMRLKVLVETAVRPVIALPSRKQKMRQELLAKLMAWYEEERLQGGPELSHLDRIAHRFGDLPGRTRELQASVPKLELLAQFFFRFPTFDLKYTPSQRAAQHLVRSALLVVPFVLVGFVIAIMAGVLSGLPFRLSDFAAGASLAFIGLWGGLSAVIMIADVMWQALAGQERLRTLRLILAVGGSAFIGPFLAVLYWMTTIRPGTTLGQELAEKAHILLAVALMTPYMLLSIYSLNRRLLYGVIDTWWRIAVRTLSSFLVVGFLSFGCTLLISGDLWRAIENLYPITVVTVFWILPLEIIGSKREFVNKIRDIWEWERLALPNQRNARV